MKRAQRCAVQYGLVAIETERKSNAFAADHSSQPRLTGSA
jgi:hypothetical protein